MGGRPGALAAKAWGAIELTVPEALDGALLAVAGSRCLGAEFRATAPGRGRLVLYFDDLRTATARREAVIAALGFAGLTPEACELRVARVEDGRWAERYQRGLRPFPIGRRFLVDPANSNSGASDRMPIALVPGQAFGTGEHPTTRLCVAMLERRVREHSRWLDVGCGSGILSVVARRCGAARVLALDIDPEAVAVAREVLRQNGIGGSVHVVRGSHDAVETGIWHGVVINISADYLLEAARAITRLPRPAGTLVASGFLEPDRDRVRRAFAATGVVEIEGRTSEGWCALALRAPSDRQ